MSKFKIIKIAVFVLAIAVSFLFTVNKACAVVGESYNSMITRYGQPESLALNKAINSKDIQNYQVKGIAVSSYRFRINGFKMIALFNPSNICYEIKTYNNRTLPNPEDLIGSIAYNRRPIIINRIRLRSVTYQYGTGTSAVIYRISGFPGDLSAIAYSPSLKP